MILILWLCSAVGKICQERLQEQGEGRPGELEGDVREVHGGEGGKVGCFEGRDIFVFVAG